MSSELTPATADFSRLTFDEPRTTFNYILDTITLKFNTGFGPTKVFMETDYPAVPTTFLQHNGVTTITLHNMEKNQGGSVPINFVISTSGQNVTGLSINAEETVHQPALEQLTCLKSQVSFEASIPTI